MWLNAGVAVSKEHAAKEGGMVNADGENYWVASGYYVPFYPVSEAELGKESQLHLLDNMSTDLAGRFFRRAEIGINARFDYEEIEELKQAYLAEKSPGIKRAKGSLLVGTVLNRLERIAHALIAERSGGNIESFDVFDPTAPSLNEQFMQYPMLLMGLEEGYENLIDNVRLRDGVKDQYGILEEMVSEVFKSFHPRMQEDKLLETMNGSRAMKIGEAMRAMDDTNAAIKTIFHTNWPHRDSKALAVTIARELTPVVNEITQFSRRRVGVKSSDAASYAEKYAVQNAALHGFRDMLNGYREKCVELKNGAVDVLLEKSPDNAGAKEIVRDKALLIRHMKQLERAIDLIEEGVEMIMNMSEMRMKHQKGQSKSCLDDFTQTINDWSSSLEQNRVTYDR